MNNIKTCATCRYCEQTVPDLAKGDGYIRNVKDSPAEWMCSLEVVADVVIGFKKKVSCYMKRNQDKTHQEIWGDDCGIEGKQYVQKDAPF